MPCGTSNCSGSWGYETGTLLAFGYLQYQSIPIDMKRFKIVTFLEGDHKQLIQMEVVFYFFVNWSFLI